MSKNVKEKRNVPRHDKCDDKAIVFVCFYFQKKLTIKSHITSNANCDYTEKHACIIVTVAAVATAAVVIVVIRPFLNATHVTNIGFYLCVFSDTSDRTWIPIRFVCKYEPCSSHNKLVDSFPPITLTHWFSSRFLFSIFYTATRLFVHSFTHSSALFFHPFVCKEKKSWFYFVLHFWAQSLA